MANQLDAHNQLSKKLRQLNGMLAMTYGGQHDVFEDLSPELRDYFLWNCSDLASDCLALFDSINVSVKVTHV